MSELYHAINGFDVPKAVSERIPLPAKVWRHSLAQNELEKWKLDWLGKCRPFVKGELHMGFDAEMFDYDRVRTMLPCVRLRPEHLFL